MENNQWNKPTIEEPLKTKRFSGLFRFIEKMAQRQAMLADSIEKKIPHSTMTGRDFTPQCLSRKKETIPDSPIYFQHPYNTLDLQHQYKLQCVSYFW